MEDSQEVDGTPLSSVEGRYERLRGQCTPFVRTYKVEVDGSVWGSFLSSSWRVDSGSIECLNTHLSTKFGDSKPHESVHRY